MVQLFIICQTAGSCAIVGCYEKIRPTVLLTVPLVIEKIYRNSVLPAIRKSKILSWMNKNQHKLMCLIFGMKLRKTFGRRFGIGIGGARLDPTVEEFFYKARFNYGVGYGLSETSSLICYALGKNRYPGSKEFLFTE